MEKILQTQKLSKKYKSQYALKDVSISIYKGDIYGLIGRNGAGKTTLLKLITQLISPTDGKVILFGSNSRNEWERNLKRIGAVIENPVAYDILSAKQNLEFYCKLRGISNSKQIIKETLELVRLENTGTKKFKNFSLGMKQKLGIAIAILARPDLLILDEPINGLDPIAITEFRRMILNLNRTENMTIIISSHILSELYQVATRFGIVNQGKLVREISKQEFDEMSEEYIILKTPQVSQASQVLEEKLNYPFKVISENQINIFGKNHHINEVNKTLLMSQIEIEEIHYFKQNLENYFTNLITTTEEER
ncbi:MULTISPECIES: ABC transporter ATP-binding protein [Lactococcus]|uniref:ATP-binding cassette domain-containing protein n=7 Tax=Lactococcus petauri TaxID=1940789 RepID=A0ABZ2SFC5_9LACT|nr:MULTISPECIES: ATP-binding cassette domain-containing protein [Lactococcus]OAL08727.1 ABC transporter ATP-binding component [Lactococcus garvieae]MCH1712367.1 ATP-binding cassette domain-containing protein [Lactococcus petauri]MCI3871596.1 ATP-binding cassette domain-containing protein [Lactococcus petauri]MCQ8275879.1 Bacitracin transport ATP-binding protein BcrA [Lactococcus petauri]MCR6589528.1 ATP-binding cassette domain-containing protein [Lactococcus petauri]